LLLKDLILLFQDKSVAKVTDEGDRRVSKMSAKAPGQVTAHYNNKQNLITVPFVKPYESTYITNR
jgi:hypothetical protein